MRRSAKSLLIQAACVLGFVLQSPAATPLGNVLALGDSITYGAGAPGGYRDPLYTRLSGAGYEFTYVGGLANGQTPLLVSHGQEHHEGHGGWVIQTRDPGDPNSAGSGLNGISDNVGKFIEALGADKKPDYILLMIGTNDIINTYYLDNAPNRLSHLISLLCDKDTGLAPRAHLIVAQLTPTTSTNSNKRIEAFNAAIPGLVGEAQRRGEKVSYVNMYSALNPATDLSDSLHPNQSGYNKMSEVWFSGIQAAAVPEPKSVALLATYATLMLCQRRMP